MKNGNVNIKEDRTSAGFLASGILNGTKEYDNASIKKFDTIEEIQNNEKINEDDKQKMIDVLEGESEYKSFNVLVKNDEYKIIYNKGTNISTMEAVKFLVNSFVEDPILIINNYIANYLATISVYDIEFEGMKIIIDREIDFINTEEIEAIGFRIYEYGLENVFPLSEEYEIYAQPYKDTNKPIVALNWIMKQLKMPNVLVMKIAFLMLPILTIISIISLFFIKNKYNKKYNRLVDMIIILFVYSFMHILIHAILGSTIDRYTIPALSTTIIGILLGIYVIVYRRKYKIDDKIEQFDKGEKIKNEKTL